MTGNSRQGVNRDKNKRVRGENKIVSSTHSRSRVRRHSKSHIKSRTHSPHKSRSHSSKKALAHVKTINRSAKKNVPKKVSSRRLASVKKALSSRVATLKTGSKATRAQKTRLTQFFAGRDKLHTNRTKRSRIGYTPQTRFNKSKQKNLKTKQIQNFAIKSIAILSLSVLFIIIIGILGVIGLVSAYSKDLPDLDKYFELQTQEDKETVLYDRTGKQELYRIRGDKIKIRTNVDNVPEKLKWAYLVTEDASFYNHKGLDYVSLTRAITCHVRGGEGCGGASTITQQVIKKTTNQQQQTIERKVREAILSMEIENKWDKDKILEFYLNLVPMGGVVEGVKGGSIYLFNKEDLSTLSTAEMAIMASIPNEPDVLSPLGENYNPDKMLTRAEYILDRMLELKDKTGVTDKEIAEAREEIRNLNFSTERYLVDFEAFHFTNYVLDELNELYKDKVSDEEINSREPVYRRYLGDKGYKIITTVDMTYQNILQETIKTQIETEVFQRDVGGQNAAAVMMDPKTGQILAMIGSKDFTQEASDDKKFDPEVNVATSDRSMGSTMKPILYLSAFESGYHPKTVLPDMPLDLSSGGGQPYSPQNYVRGSYSQDVIPIDQALRYSLNVPAVAAYHLIGGDQYADTFVRLNGWEPIRERMYPSAPLGAANVPLLEQTHAYNTMASGGIYYPKTSILRIEDSDGNVIEDFSNREGKRTVEEKYAHLITQLNEDYYLFKSDDLLSHIQNNVTDIAGKTGTSDNTAGAPGDASFIAYTPQFTLGLWTGNNCGAEKCPLTGAKASGEHLYFNMYKQMLQKFLDQDLMTNERFPDSVPGVVQTTVCPKTGRLASEQCPGVPVLTADTSIPPEEDMLVNLEVTRCGDTYKLARQIDRELGLTEIKSFFNYKFPNQYIQDQVNNAIGTGVIPTEVCNIERRIRNPEASILTPRNGAEYDDGDEIYIEADVIKTLAINKVDFIVNGNVVSSDESQPYSAKVSTSRLNPGDNSIRVIAYDIRGNKGESTTISISIKTNEPEPEPTSPPDSELSLNISSPATGRSFSLGSEISASAAFAGVSQSNISSAYFQVLEGGSLVSNYSAVVGGSSFTANIAGLSKGNYTLEATLVTKEGGSISDSTTFNVE